CRRCRSLQSDGAVSGKTSRLHGHGPQPPLAGADHRGNGDAMMAKHATATGEPSVRLLRVGEAMRHVLADILQRGDVHDDVLARHVVSVTEVRMSPDLRHAI